MGDGIWAFDTSNIRSLVNVLFVDITPFNCGTTVVLNLYRINIDYVSDTVYSALVLRSCGQRCLPGMWRDGYVFEQLLHYTVDTC